MKLDLEKGLSQLFFGISTQKSVVYIKRTKVLLKVLEILHSKGIILSYRQDLGQNRIVVTPHYNLAGCISKIYVLPKNSYLTFSYEKLLNYIVRKGPCVALLYNPWFGIISHQFALEKGVGGRIICVIYY
jgi:ribosomal protein S8|tara:strand:+ start:69 stop:458 length:390 start_codon:yes stop_codon:yes gene_type:complete